MEVIHEIPRLPLHKIDNPTSRSFKIEKKLRDEELYLSDLPRRYCVSIEYLGSPKFNQRADLELESRSYLNRTLSIPFLHSWEFNNVDASSLIVSPRIGSVRDIISLRWKKEVMNLFSANKPILSYESFFKKIKILCTETKVEKDAYQHFMTEFRLHGIKVEKGSNSKYELSSGIPNSIIRSLVDFDAYVHDHILSILLTHEYWITSMHLLSKLISTFWFQKNGLFGKFLVNFEITPALKMSIQKRILRILFLWISHKPNQFKNLDLKNRVIEFIQSLKQEKVVSRAIISIFSKLFRNITNIDDNLNTCSVSSKYLTFLEMNIRDLAKQLTLYDFNQMSRLDIGFLQNFSKTKNPMIQDIFNRTSKMQSWVMTEILSCNDINKRSMLLTNFIQLCQYLLDLKNYHSSYDIYHALTHNRILKIHSMWNKLSKDTLNTWNIINQKLKSDSDFFDLSLAAEAPKVLSLSLCIKFISFQEKEPSFLHNDSKALNFLRLKGIYEILKPFSDSQRYMYNIEPILELQNYLANSITGFPESKLEFLSKEIEILQAKKIHFNSPFSSRCNQKKPNDVNQSRSSSSLSAREKPTDRIIAPRKSTSTHTVNVIKKKVYPDDINRSIDEELKEKWRRSLDKCSVGQDLPRFANKITIMNNENILFKPQKNHKDEKIAHTIRKILFIIAGQLGAKKEIYAMETSFDLFFEKESSDILKESDRFVKEVFGEKSKVSSLLKAACTQGIVSPAWLKLKMDILKGFPFKDHKQGWSIGIIFSSKDVLVVHRKEEISFSEKDEIQFKFTWELSMTFSKKMETMLSSSLNIVDLEIINLSEKRSSSLKLAIKPWYFPKNSKFPSLNSKKLKRRSFHDIKSSKKRLSLSFKI